MLKVVFWVAGFIAFLLVTQSGNGVFENMVFLFVFTPSIAVVLIWVLGNMGFRFDEQRSKPKKPAYQVDDWLDPGGTRHHQSPQTVRMTVINRGGNHEDHQRMP